MAKIEKWYRCPGCKAVYYDRDEAEKCAVSHVHSEIWAVSTAHPGKFVRVTVDKTAAQAMIEADIPD